MDSHRQDLLTTGLNAFLVVSLLVVISLAMDIVDSKEGTPISSSVVARNIAIEEAKNKGIQEYQYVTGFVPGFGAPPIPEGPTNNLKVVENN